MTDHQIILAGAWTCAAIGWAVPRVTGGAAGSLTLIAVLLSYI